MLKRILAGATAAALLSACGGGAQQSALPSSSSSGTAPATLSITVPGGAVTTASGKRIPLYVSRSTSGVGIDVSSTASYTNAPNASPQYGTSLTAGAGVCGTANADKSFTCTITLHAPVGHNNIRISFWNAGPTGCSATGSGCSFASASALSTTVTSATIYAGSNNSLGGFTLNPVVDSISVQLSGTIGDYAARTYTAYVVLKDASGNTIAGNDQLYDANGNALNLTAQLTNNSKDNGAACGTATPVAADACSLYFNSSSAYSTASSVSQITINYDGLYAFPTSGSLPGITIAVDHAISGANAPATFVVTSQSLGTTVPGAPQYGSHATLSLASPVRIVAGGDGYLYVQENLQNQLQRFQPSAPGTVQNVTLATGVVGTGIPGLAAGTDNTLWYVDGANSKIVHQNYGTTGANAVSYSMGTDSLCCIGAGPDGNMWFGDNTTHAVVRIDANMTGVTSHPTTAAGSIGRDIAGGTFANGHQAVCYDNATKTVECYDITAAGTIDASTLPVDTRANGGVTCNGNQITITGLAFGSDGALYVTLSDGRINAYSGALALLHTYTPADYSAVNCQNFYTTSPVKGYGGALWYVDQGGANKIGRIAVGSSASPYPIADWSTTQLPGSALGGMVVGADNKLWLNDATNSFVDQILP